MNKLEYYHTTTRTKENKYFLRIGIENLLDIYLEKLTCMNWIIQNVDFLIRCVERAEIFYDYYDSARRIEIEEILRNGENHVSWSR